MSHVFTLALVFALVLEAARLLHASAAGWAATRRLTLEPATLIGAAIAAAIGMALAANAVTAALAPGLAAAAWSSHPGWLHTTSWLGALVLLFLTLLLHDTHRLGRVWRAMGANAAGLVAIGVPLGLGLPMLLGLVLAALAGQLAPPPATTDWLPLACLALLVLGRPARPRGSATVSALVGWLAGAVVGALELLLGPPGHVLAIAAAALVATRLAATRVAAPRVAEGQVQRPGIS